MIRNTDQDLLVIEDMVLIERGGQAINFQEFNSEFKRLHMENLHFILNSYVMKPTKFQKILMRLRCTPTFSHMIVSTK